VHDIGIVLSQIGAGETGYEVTVGRGQDRAWGSPKRSATSYSRTI